MESGDASDEEAPPCDPKSNNLMQKAWSKAISMLVDMETEDSLRPGLIEGECVENILPNGRCFADVMAQMRRSVLMIPRDSPHSPFSISPQ